MTRDKRAAFVNEARRRLASGDENSTKGYVTQSILSNEDVSTRNDLESRAETINILDHVNGLLDKVPTNIVRGTFEDIVRKLGMSSNPQYVTIANELKCALFAYRKAMTGVQFSLNESKDYEKMFPNYKNEPPVNKAAIEGLRNGFSLRNDTFWKRRVGEDVANYLGVMSHLASTNVRIQRNKRTGETRYSTDGGATWQPGLPPQ
jgi:hypothetical protein